jgi:hypothetical protein
MPSGATPCADSAMTIAPRVERAEPASQSKRAGRASGCDHEFPKPPAAQGASGFSRKSPPGTNARSRALEPRLPFFQLWVMSGEGSLTREMRVSPKGSSA